MTDLINLMVITNFCKRIKSGLCNLTNWKKCGQTSKTQQEVNCIFEVLDNLYNKESTEKVAEKINNY